MAPAWQRLAVLHLVAGRLATQATNYNCSLPGLQALTPGKYAGQEVNYLSAVTDISSPQFRDRAVEFEACTGARINFAEANNVFEDPIKDVGTKTATGLSLYDGYLMSYSHFPEASALGLAETLKDRIRASNSRLRWEDFFEMVQRQGQYRRNGQDDIDFLMFDGDFFVPLVRIDLLQKHNMSVPNTWDEVLEYARYFNGKDLNDDGEPDYGFCHFPRIGAGTWDWWWAELVYSTWATMAQKDTNQGFYFDVETFEPLVDNAAFREAARIWKELWKMGVDGCPGHMATGRCAIGYSPPGCWKGVFLGQVERTDENGTVVWQPTLDDGSYAAPYRALPFGSLKVLNADGELEPCTEDTCKLDVDPHGHVKEGGVDRAAILKPSPLTGKKINRAPFFWSGGFGTMIRKSASAEAKSAIWDFFVYINSPETSVTDVSTYASWIDSWRRSQLSVEGGNFVQQSTWDAAAYAEHRSVMWSSLGANSNGALNLRIPGIKEYTFEALGDNMQRYIDGNITEEELVVVVKREWEKISRERGLVDQLQIYRATLGLEQLGEFDLCQLHRDSMDADDPRICRKFDPEESDSKVVMIVLITCGTLVGAGLLLAFVVWIVRAVLEKRRLQRKEEMRKDRLVEEALGSMKTLRFPMVLLEVASFMDLGQFLTHEEIRDGTNFKLTWLDTVEAISAFLAEHFVLFLSHQWLSFTAPDPEGTQYRCARTAVRQCLEAKGWEISKAFVWVDIFSIPQVNKALQTIAIASLPVYASSANMFIVIAPDAQHVDTAQQCDIDSYKNRAWCRAELLSHSLTNGTADMHLADQKNISTVKLESELMRDALFVFEGELSCCRMKHKGMACCDREQLMVPFLGLYCLQHILKTKGSEEDESMQEFLQKIDQEKVRMFPEEISVLLTDQKSGKEKTEARLLFKGLLDKMKRKADSLGMEELEAMGFLQNGDHDLGPSVCARSSRVTLRRSSLRSKTSRSTVSSAEGPARSSTAPPTCPAAVELAPALNPGVIARESL